MRLVAGAGVIVNEGVNLGADYDVRLWEYEPEREERNMLAAGGRLVITVACIEPPVMNPEVRAPLCRCGEYMRWEPRLEIYVCPNHEERDERPPE